MKMHQTFEEELQVQQVLYEFVHQGRVPVILQTQQVVATLSQVLPYKISLSQSYMPSNHTILSSKKIHVQAFLTKHLYFSKVNILFISVKGKKLIKMRKRQFHN